MKRNPILSKIIELEERKEIIKQLILNAEKEKYPLKVINDYKISLDIATDSLKRLIKWGQVTNIIR